MARKSFSELTLKDRLSHLSFTQATKLLGGSGKSLIQQGGAIEIENLEEQVKLEESAFTLTLPDATVKIFLSQEKRNALQFNCSVCSKPCLHIGAAVSFILEEKTYLGLAKPPKERVAVENLSEGELIAFEIKKRQEKSLIEKMKITSKDKEILWTDYHVSNTESGKSYRVALRGWENGESFCSCPDFKRNTLGICKHIFYTIKYARKKFGKAECSIPYKRKHFSVYLYYGNTIQVRLGVPAKVSDFAKELIKKIDANHVLDLHHLLNIIKKLEQNDIPVIVYPDAEEYISHQLNRKHLVSIAEEIKVNPKTHPLRKSLLKVELLPHQMEGIGFVVGANRAILADDMGLGKTIQGIGVAELLAKEAGISKVLIVCPTSLKSQWKSEIEKFSNRTTQLVVGSYDERNSQYESKNFFTICNYEQLLRDLVFVKNMRWDLIILDEAQKIKNWEAKTTRNIKELNTRFALALTGTPIENKLAELYSIVEFIDNRHLGPAFRFFNQHNVADERGALLSYKNLDQLREKLKPILLRRTRNLVMKDLPSRRDQIIRIPATKEQKEFNLAQMQIVQNTINKPFLTEMDLIRIQKALLLARMNADSTFLITKTGVGYSSKLEKLKEILDQIKEDPLRKCVLFSEWTTMLDIIEQELEKRKLPFVRLDGQVPQKKRQLLVDEFRQNPKCTFFLTTNAGSTGLNLQVANTVINVDLPWNPAVLEQRIARAHRMGQKNNVHVYILVTDGTIEEKMLGTLANKKQLALAALDYNSDVNEVSITSCMEDLKSKLEELLGAKPEVSEDRDSKEMVEKALKEKRENIAVASGNLLNSMFELMGSLMTNPLTPEVSHAKNEMQEQLKNSVEADENGRPTLKITLPNIDALGNMAHVLAMMTQNLQKQGALA